MQSNFLTGIRHPAYLEDQMSWHDWRDTYDGGDRFVRKNLRRFSNRETPADFADRKFCTPIQSFAKVAVNDVRNSIFQRLRDVYRREGSENYMKATAGEIGGVDNKGASMQQFLGIDVLTELLVMGRAGVYTDMPTLSGYHSMADEGNARPYNYMYKVEDILSWTVAKPEEPGEFTAILLRDQGIDYNQGFVPGVRLPCGGFIRYRFLWIDPVDRKVRMKLLDDKDGLLDWDGNTITSGDGITRLELDRIPFTMLDIGGSLLKDVYKHQVALLNLGSADVSYALKANYALFVEQRDMRAVGTHLKKSIDDDGTSNTSDNSKPGVEARTGVTYGRQYDMKADAPSFIHPSSEPLLASMKLQEKLEDDIRKLVNLAVQNKTGQRAISAEAMKLSDQGLEAGLSYIGLVLEGAERRIAEHWAAYENKNPSKRQIATIKYPDRYSLKNDEDRIKEAKELAELMYTVPGTDVKKELSKNIVTALLSGKANTKTIDGIFAQIDKSNYATSDPETIIRAHEAGLVGEQTASIALGFGPEEYLQARKDHIARAEAIMKAQQAGKEESNDDMAARGLPDLDPDKKSGKGERDEANDTTLKVSKKSPDRGEGKDLNKGE
jgi:hypothetical protein